MSLTLNGKCWTVIFCDLHSALCQVFICHRVCLTLSDIGWSVLLRLLHRVSRVALVLVCLTLIECQRFVRVFVCFILRGNVSLVLGCILH